MLPKKSAWKAFHYIYKNLGIYYLRNGAKVKKSECLHEDNIKMCEYGLHASLCKKDAAEYRPCSAVLTEVLIWGRIIIGRDKLVATDRKIIREL